MDPLIAAEPGGNDDPLLPVVGPSTEALIQMLRIFAEQDETLLLSGPSGTGKSRLAEWCHVRSPRRSGRFQVVDLLSVPEDMQMGEIFGWKRGAFTGAVQDQEGCVARSQGGTLFIDEIDKLSLKAQAGLLHLLETRRYRSLGDAGQQRSADVRFVVATSADLKAEVTRGRFREDLYFRINVLPLRVPPLAQRPEEIVPWARFMLSRRHREARAPGDVHLSSEAADALAGRAWPGNLRQLDNVLRRAYALALGDGQGPGGAPGSGLVVGLVHVERSLRLDGVDPAPSLMTSLRRVAGEFIDEAHRLALRGQHLDLEQTNAFRGLVLEAGVQRMGDVRKVFRLLGSEVVLRSRNHGREYRRELEKVARLEEELAPTARRSPAPRDDEPPAEPTAGADPARFSPQP